MLLKHAFVCLRAAHTRIGMDLPWGEELSGKFVTNIGLITSTGPYGNNIMACEWTHHVSYSPGLVAACIRPDDATHANIRDTREFGVSIASTEQAGLSSISGKFTGSETDKVGLLKELGFSFYQASSIKALMVDGAVLNLECRLVSEVRVGDHTMFIGEVLNAKAGKGRPLAYHERAYYSLTQDIPKPSAEEREFVENLAKKYAKRK